jgi:uncharacterized protein YjbJ (UPF0337 family)
MLDQDVLEGKWHTIRGKLKGKWGKLTEDDLAMVDGGIEALIGRIQRRTGESREVIEHFLDQAAQHISASAEQLGHTAQDAVHEVSRRVRDRYQQAEQVVHDRPGQAVLVAFGLGVVSGLGAALLLTASRKERSAVATCSSLRQSSEQLAKHLSDVIMSALPESMGGRR